VPRQFHEVIFCRPCVPMTAEIDVKNPFSPRGFERVEFLPRFLKMRSVVRFGRRAWAQVGFERLKTRG